MGKDTAFFGEIGLTGEVRKIVNMEARLKECERLGIKRVFCPRGVEKVKGLETVALKTIRDLYEHIGDGRES